MGPILQISKLNFRDVKYLTKICAASEGSWGFPAELSEGGWRRRGGQCALGLLLVSSSIVHSLCWFPLLPRYFRSCLLTASSFPLSETQRLWPALPSPTINLRHRPSAKHHPWLPSWPILEPSTDLGPGGTTTRATCYGLTLASPSPQI